MSRGKLRGVVIFLVASTFELAKIVGGSFYKYKIYAWAQLVTLRIGQGAVDVCFYVVEKFGSNADFRDRGQKRHEFFKRRCDCLLIKIACVNVHRRNKIFVTGLGVCKYLLVLTFWQNLCEFTWCASVC